MKKYLFFFENELIKVENSLMFGDFVYFIWLSPLFFIIIYNQNLKDLGKITPNSTIFNFDRLVLEEK